MNTKFDAYLVNIIETMQQFASSAIHGKHLWLGVIYSNMIAHLQERGPDFPLVDSKTTPRANKWKKEVLKIITPRKKGAKEMWAIKETSSRQVQFGDAALMPANLKTRDLQRRQRHSDIVYKT